MPRLTQEVPKYRKHRASGQALVEINGRRHYLGPHGTKASRIEYDRLIAEWLSTGRSISFGAPNHVFTITELVVAYLEYAKGYYGDGNRGEFANMRLALRPLRRLYGPQAASDFGPLQLKTVRQTFIAVGNSRKYINQQVRRIGRTFRWAVSEGLVKADVPQALATVTGLRKGHTSARETNRVRPVDDALVDATLPHLPPVVRVMVELQRTTGMRPGEICIVRPCDINCTDEVWEYSAFRLRRVKRDGVKPCTSLVRRRSAVGTQSARIGNLGLVGNPVIDIRRQATSTLCGGRATRHSQFLHKSPKMLRRLPGGEPITAGRQINCVMRWQREYGESSILNQQRCYWATRS